MILYFKNLNHEKNYSHRNSAYHFDCKWKKLFFKKLSLKLFFLSGKRSCVQKNRPFQ